MLKLLIKQKEKDLHLRLNQQYGNQLDLNDWEWVC